MENKTIVRKRGNFLSIITFLLAFFFASNVNGQILLGPSYGIEISDALGTSYARSGFLVNASYFVSPNVSLNLALGYFGKALVDSSFNKLSYWTEMSEVFSVNYYFSTSNVRPYLGAGFGHFNDAISKKELSKYFNENSLAIAGEVGLLANLSPRVKLNVSVKYNYLLTTSKNNFTATVGLLIPLKAE
jgi:outer membrane protein W